MKALALMAALVAVLTLISPVLAQDYINDAAQALQQARVYVALGTEGTDTYTESRLEARLNSNDNIVLVMMPSSAEADTGADAFTIASRLSEKLGNRRIIGLAVGNTVVGYAPYMPAGVAADQMRRAQSVSNDPVTALSTFTLNIHLIAMVNSENHTGLSEAIIPKLGSPATGGALLDSIDLKLC